MKKYIVIAFNDQDDKMQVFSSASFEEAVSVASALYRCSELEFRIYASDAEHDCLVSFIKPVNLFKD